MAVLETRAHGEVPAIVERRPGTGGQGNDSECEHSSPFPYPPAYALEERRPHHSSSSVDEWRALPLPNMSEGRRNRRAPGTSAGGKHGCDERSRSEQTGSSPVGGDQKIADVSAVNRRHCRIKDAIWAIWVICGQFARAGGRPSCLCVFVFAMFSVFLSVSLCLCGSTGGRTTGGITAPLPVWRPGPGCVATTGCGRRT